MPAATAAAPAVELAAAAGERPMRARCTTVVGMDALAVEEDFQDDSPRRAARAHGVDAIEVPPNVAGCAPRHACAVAGVHAPVPARLHARVAASASARPSRAAGRIASARVQWRGRGTGGEEGDVGRGFGRAMRF